MPGQIYSSGMHIWRHMLISIMGNMNIWLLYYVSIFYRFFYFDAFQAAASPTIPTICGSNQGQHGNNCNKNIVYNISRIEQKIMIRSFIFFSKNLLVVYIDMGQGATDTATLNFDIGSGTYSRFYEIKVTQLPCSSEYQ